MNQAVTLASSALVAAVVSGGISYASQSRLQKQKARDDYEFVAKKRLYEVIGPLRVQLLFSARDVVGRVSGHRHDLSWNLEPSAYYVKSFIYRLLRPLAVGLLIERQMSVMDFSVDRAALDLLRFNRAFQKMLSGDRIVPHGVEVDWSAQTQHLWRDNLRAAAATLIAKGDDGIERVLDFSQFQREIPDPRLNESLQDLAAIFERCKGNLIENAVFWLRIVGYGYACNTLLALYGSDVGLEPVKYRVAGMLKPVNEEHISADADNYSAVFDSIIEGKKPDRDAAFRTG